MLKEELMEIVKQQTNLMVLLFNTNNALQTNCPIIPMAIMTLYAFKYEKK